MPIEDQEMYVFLKKPPWNKSAKRSKPLFEEVNHHLIIFSALSSSILEPLKM
jgi:hypothetical protein